MGNTHGINRSEGEEHMNERDKEFARQAGMVYRKFEDEFANANTDGVDQATMQRFADLIRADEREACAKVCEEQEELRGHTPFDCAAAIRARGNA
jgi:predicted P-loop ATPase